MPRFAVFLTIVLSVWGGMHAYVLSRVWSLPWIAQTGARRWVVAATALLAVSYPLVRSLSRSLGRSAFPLDVVASVWVGVLFLLLAWLLAADVVTGFGFVFRAHVTRVRTAAVAIAGVLSVVALIQAARPPAVRSHEVELPGLPAALDGLVLVQISDLHLGPMLGESWVAARIEQVRALRPDLVVVNGDLVDHDVGKVEGLVPVLRRLSAPLGVFAVTGNHEFYAGLGRSLALLEGAGFRVLRDAHAEVAPGLVLAGVDDPTGRRQTGEDDGFLERALEGRPPGAVVLLSHSPKGVEGAADLGVGLMLSGHTHGGQIWPFRYLVKLAYPRVEGEYRAGGMTLLVSRGTGFWGPPMRFPRRSEILRITLRAA